VRQNCPDKHTSCVEVNRGNQAQLVAADVKHKHIADFIGTGEECPQLCKITPIGFLAKSIPLIKRAGTLGMRLLCSHNPAMGDDVHAGSLSQNEIFASFDYDGGLHWAATGAHRK